MDLKSWWTEVQEGNAVVFLALTLPIQTPSFVIPSAKSINNIRDKKLLQEFQDLRWQISHTGTWIAAIVQEEYTRDDGTTDTVDVFGEMVHIDAVTKPAVFSSRAENKLVQQHKGMTIDLRQALFSDGEVAPSEHTEISDRQDQLWMGCGLYLLFGAASSGKSAFAKRLRNAYKTYNKWDSHYSFTHEHAAPSRNSIPQLVDTLLMEIEKRSVLTIDSLQGMFYEMVISTTTAGQGTDRSLTLLIRELNALAFATRTTITGLFSFELTSDSANDVLLSLKGTPAGMIYVAPDKVLFDSRVPNMDEEGYQDSVRTSKVKQQNAAAYMTIPWPSRAESSIQLLRAAAAADAASGEVARDSGDSLSAHMQDTPLVAGDIEEITMPLGASREDTTYDLSRQLKDESRNISSTLLTQL